MDSANLERQVPGKERVACREDGRRAFGSTKQEGLNIGSLFEKRGQLRTNQNEVVHPNDFCE